MGSSSLALTMPFYPELSGRTRLRAPERRGTREHQRLDHDRHGAGGLEQRADVDEVEFLENDPVDRHDRVRHARFFAAMNADQAADVAVADEDERGAPLEHFREARRHAPAEIIEPRERRGPCPAIAQRNRLFAFVKIEAAQGCAHRLRDPLRVEGLAVERQGLRDDPQVAQRKGGLRRNLPVITPALPLDGQRSEEDKTELQARVETKSRRLLSKKKVEMRA